MRIKGRGVAVAALSALGLASLPTLAVAQTTDKTMGQQMIGHWELVSITSNGMQPYGPHPKGSMFVDGNGHYSIIVVSAGEAPDISFFGSYKYDPADTSVTLHIDGSNRPDAEGRDMKRLMSMNGDTMIADSPASAAFGSSITMTWKRAD